MKVSWCCVEVRGDHVMTRWRPAILAIVALAITAGCTSTPQHRQSPGPGVTLGASLYPASPMNGRQAAEQDALAAYRGMWQAYVAAVRVPDPTDRNLARFAAGEALQTLTSGLQSLKDQGLKGSGEISVSPKISAATPADAPTAVSVRDCVDTTGSTIVRASPGGPPYSDTPGGRRLCLAEVTRQPDGQWRVTSFGVREVGTCG